MDITFPFQSQWDGTRLGFRMQVNRMAGESSPQKATFCVDAVMNISRTEGRDQIVEFFKTSTSDPNFDSNHCNSTVNMTISSETIAHVHVTISSESIAQTHADHDNAPDNAATEGQKQTQLCNSHLAKELVLTLIIIILLSLVIVLGTILIYTNYCHKESR